MTWFLRRTLVPVVALAALAACDDGTDPVPTSTVDVLVYVDADNSSSFDAATDVAISGATVELTPVGATDGMTATTGADGVATFAAVEVGSYTATVTGGVPAGTTLGSATAPTVVVNEDANADVEFRYTYEPSSIAGHTFLGDGAYAAGDMVVGGLEVVLTGTDRADTVTTAVDGSFEFSGLLPGDYTVTVDVLPFLLPQTASETITLAADEDATLDFGFAAEATHTIAEARAAEVDAEVTVVGVAVTATAGEQAALSGSSFYLQNDAGIAVYLADVNMDVVLGDSVLVYGTRSAFNSEVQVEALSALNFGAGTLPTPVAVTVAEIQAGANQGELGMVESVLVESVNGGNVWVRDLVTGNRLLVYVDSDAGIDTGTAFTVGQFYDITGALARYGADYEIKPRMPGDIADATVTATTVADVRAAAATTPVTVTAMVTEAGTLEGNGFYIQDATAGIFVYTGFGNVPAELAIGDVVTVSGDRAQYYDVAQIGGTVTVDISATNVVPEPTTVTPTTLNSGDVQGQLVTLTDVVVDSVAGSNVWVSDADGTAALVRIDSDSGIQAAAFVVDDTYTITGVVSNFGGTEQLKPRFEEDVIGFVVLEPVTTIGAAREAVAGNPVDIVAVVNAGTDTYSTASFYVQDGTAGINVYMPSSAFDPRPTFTAGDSVRIVGERGLNTFAQEIQIVAESIELLGTGATVTVTTVTPAQVEAGEFQGELVLLDNVEVTVISGSEITVSDGTNTTTIYVDADTGIDIATELVVGQVYDITGVVAEFQGLNQVKPRASADITAGS